MHTEKHPLAGKTIRVKSRTINHQGINFDGAEYRLEDWWDHLTGGSWQFAQGNPACIQYAIRSALTWDENSDRVIPIDDEVVYGKIGAFGHLIHVSEIGDIID